MKKCILFITVSILFACNPISKKGSQEIVELPETIGRYVSEYTPREISVQQDLMVRFNRAVVETEQIGQALDKKIVSISPNVNGAAIWQDESTLVYVPTEQFQYDTDYMLNIKLKSLFTEVEESLQVIHFPFKTKAIGFNILYDQINYGMEQDGATLSITGRIETNDVVNGKAMADMLKAKQAGNKAVQVTWLNHRNNDHFFSIDQIERSDQASEVEIVWDFSALKGVSRKSANVKGSDRISILPKNKFSLIEATAVNGTEKAVRVMFSEALNERQDLNGLVSFKGYNGKLRFSVLGSELMIYPSNKIVGPVQLILDEAIQKKSKDKLDQSYEISLSFDPVKPAVRLLGKGVIVPHSEQVFFPFEAINLKSVDVEVFKIYSDNVLQYLQYNKLDDEYGLNPVGKVVHQQHIDLSEIEPADNSYGFIRYALDISNFVALDAGAIYQIRIGFSRSDLASYPCDSPAIDVQEILVNRDGFTSIMERPIEYNYDYRRRDDPCERSYYRSSRFIKRNVLASNISIIAKRNADNGFYFNVTDIRTIDPISGARIDLYDFQQQKIVGAQTDGKGEVTLKTAKKASFGILTWGEEFSYINLQDQYANSLSEFDVSGSQKRDGIDGVIYGDRGVWRPGDTLFMNFVMEDKLAKLPLDHPVRFKVTDPQGKVKYDQTKQTHVGQIYHFPVVTNTKDPTGNWRASAIVGNNTFQKTLKIETVKPNRLKIDFDLISNRIALYDNAEITLNSSWLHGASADGLKARVDLQLRPVTTSFKGFSDFKFDDPARRIDPIPFTIFEDELDEEGQATIRVEANKNTFAPGKLKASFHTKVFEKGGDFSEYHFTAAADMFEAYVGISIPRTRWGYKFIEEFKPTPIPIVVLDKDGKALKNRKLKVGIYEAKWNWWYDRNYSSRYQYNSAQHNGAVSKSDLVTDKDGKANFIADFKDYGNYMIRVCDEVSGHCTGDLFYTGRSWSSYESKKEGPAQLVFTTDKKSYGKGEDIQVKIPSNAGAKIFVSVESGDEVQYAYWIDAKDGTTNFSIPTDDLQSSTVYVHAHLVQKHNYGVNDLPIRMFGVQSVRIVDPVTKLNVDLKMPTSLKPNEKFKLSVSEKDDKAMSYTIAIVDEGLLALTRYKTPVLWDHFYAKQALHVKTWDLYDYVLNQYGGKIDKYISIGGDEDGGAVDGAKEANRFIPVVRHLGPFFLEAGKTAHHEVDMPNYVGAVRAMVVARHKEAYGSSSTSVQVKKPLMLQSTLPRVLGPGEKVSVPVNLFAMEDDVKKVNVGLSTSQNISVLGASKQILEFTKIGDQQAYFDIEVGDEIGIATIKLEAKSGKHSSYEEIEIEIRNPNPYTSEVKEISLQPGEEKTLEYLPFGTKGTNEAVVEFSQVPPMNFTKRLRYLIRYPYGCIEQTTSSVFPQLYLSEVMELSDRDKWKTQSNISKGISRLALFQLHSGAFSYWPGDREASEWGTNYAGHFLLEAKEKGHFVSDVMINGFLTYLSKTATEFQWPEQSHEWKVRSQSYRLFILAKGGKANIGAMNRMRNYEALDNTSSFMLAAAFAIIGKTSIAEAIVAKREVQIMPYMETGDSYGSDIRDMSMIAEALGILDRKAEQALQIKLISQRMNGHRWYSTQTTAYSLLSIGKFLSAYDQGEMDIELQNNNEQIIHQKTTKAVYQIPLEINSAENGSVRVKNTGTSIMYVKLVVSGQRKPDPSIPGKFQHIKMNVAYYDMEGNDLDPLSIPIGTDFKAVVNVKNLLTRSTRIEELAISQIFPSGWQIINTRLMGMGNVNKDSRADYRDYRDDRVYTFFDIHGSANYKYTVFLNASYAGEYYLPPVSVEAMYDNEIQSHNSGHWVKVVR